MAKWIFYRNYCIKGEIELWQDVQRQLMAIAQRVEGQIVQRAEADIDHIVIIRLIHHILHHIIHQQGV